MKKRRTLILLGTAAYLFLLRLLVAAAALSLVTGRLLPRLQELEHLRWMRFYALHGWRYAEKRDNARRLHPDLRPYGALSPAERAKDDYAWELLAPLAEELEREERNESRGAGR